MPVVHTARLNDHMPAGKLHLALPGIKFDPLQKFAAVFHQAAAEIDFVRIQHVNGDRQGNPDIFRRRLQELRRILVPAFGRLEYQLGLNLLRMVPA